VRDPSEINVQFWTLTEWAVEKETYCSGEVNMEWLKDLEEEGSIGIDDGERRLMAKTTNRPSRGNIRDGLKTCVGYSCHRDEYLRVVQICSKF
jgi:hypothetical protein